MSMILDIHTHNASPQPEALISVAPSEFKPVEGQLYSVGIHPWDTVTPMESKELELLESVAAHPQVAAIGETGIDMLKGGPLFKQMQLFKFHIELSEKLKKPLVIHDVRAHDVILGLKRDLKPRMIWTIHGFRAKPGVAKMFTDVGMLLSFGEKFNSESLKSVPEEMLLAETDESPLNIKEIIASLSDVRGEDLTQTIERNATRFLNREE